MKSLSRVQLFVTPWIVAHQAPPSMGFSRQEYWSGLPFPCPGDLPNPGIEHRSPTLQADALPSEPPGNLFTTWFTNILDLLLRTTAWEKKKSFQNMLTDNAPRYPRAVMEMYKNDGIFMSANTAFILQPIDQGVISIFKFYYH